MAAVLSASLEAVSLEALEICDEVVASIAADVERQGYAVVDGALGEAHASALRASCLAVEKKASTIAEGTEMTVDGSRRDDVVGWVKESNDETIARHRRAMDGLRERLEAALGLKMDSSSFMTAEYAAGSKGYVRHRDAAPRRPSGRKLTALYYLNPAWAPGDGGELRLWPGSCDEAYLRGAAGAGADLAVAPKNDRLVVFRSPLEHAVLASRARRVALTTWFFNRLELGLELIAEKRALRAKANEEEAQQATKAAEEIFECEVGCGFRGAFDAVAAHEKTCRPAAAAQ